MTVFLSSSGKSSQFVSPKIIISCWRISRAWHTSLILCIEEISCLGGLYQAIEIKDLTHFGLISEKLARGHLDERQRPALHS